MSSNRIVPSAANSNLSPVVSQAASRAQTVSTAVVQAQSGAIAATVSVPDLAASADSGQSNSDNMTKVTTPTLTGSAEPGATVILYEERGSTRVQIGTGMADGSGAWSVVTVPLTDGAHVIVAQATDLLGKVSTSTQALTIIIDKTAPAAPFAPDLLSASDSGTSRADNITNVAALNFSGIAEANSIVSLFDGATKIGSVIAGANGLWMFSTSALGEGSHSLTAKSTDAAGNVSAASGALIVTIDRSPPAAPTAPDLLVDSDSGASNTDNITRLATPTISGRAEVGSRIALYDGALQVGSAAAADGTWSVVTPTLSDGVHRLGATATDIAGNISAISAELTITIDTVAPAAPAELDLLASSDSGISDSDNLTGKNAPTISGKAEAGMTITLFDGATPVGSTVADNAGAWTITALPLAEGDHSLTATATDLAGNVSPPSSALVVTIDTAAPAPPGTPDLDAGSDSGISNSDNITSVNTPLITGSADAGAVVTLFDGADKIGEAIADASGVWSLTIAAALGEGPHILTAIASDVAGNASVASAPLVVRVDTQAPSITSAETAEVAENADASLVVYTASASDGPAGTNLVYSLSGPDAALLSIDAITGAVTLNAPADFETKASYNFTVVATDQVGLTATRAVVLSINNVNEAPIITSAASVDVAENTPASTVVYTATASDVDTGAVLTYSLTGADAALFSIDPATGAINLNASADFETKSTYNFDVVVTDQGGLTGTQAVVLSVANVNEAPVITSGATATVAENAVASAVVYTATATDVDAGGALAYLLSGADASLLSINSTTGTVTLKNPANFEAKNSYSFNVVATDQGGLQASKAVTLSVTNVNEAPVITSGSTATVAENTAASTVVYTVTATDVDASTTLTYSLSGADASLLNINTQTGAVTLKTPADYETKNSYSFNVIASDNGSPSLSSAPRAVTLSISDIVENTPPVAWPDYLPSTNAGVPMTFSTYTLLANDSDAETAVYFDSITWVSGGTVNVYGSTALFTPAPGFSGQAIIQYQIRDAHGAAATSIAFITVNEVKIDLPPDAQDDNISTNEDQAVTISASTLLNNDRDDGSISLISVSGASHGTVSLSNGQIRFAPDKDFNGTATFNYTIQDNVGQSDSATAYVNVVSVNDAPVARTDYLDGGVMNERFVVSANVLLANDFDVEDGVPRAAYAEQIPGGHGSAVRMGEEFWFYPDPGFTGVAFFAYLVSDREFAISMGTVYIWIAAPTSAQEMPSVSLIGVNSDPSEGLTGI